MNENIQPHNNDVFTSSSLGSYGLPQTMQILEFKNEIIRRIQASCQYSVAGWLNGGLDGSLLQSDGSGWIPGKIVLKVEFIPNEPKQITPESQKSPLDDLRQQVTQG